MLTCAINLLFYFKYIQICGGLYWPFQLNFNHSNEILFWVVLLCVGIYELIFMNLFWLAELHDYEVLLKLLLSDNPKMIY